MVKTIRYRLVWKYLAGVLIILGIFLSATAITAPILGETAYILHFLLPSILLLSIGLWIYRAIPEKDVVEIEAIAITTLSFPLAGLAGLIPYISTGTMPPMDALFESISGFTTTGFTLLDTSRSPRVILLWRSLTQWIGGMGFIVMSIGMLLVSERAVVQLFSIGGPDTKLLPRMVHHVRIIISTYVLLTLLGIFLLLLSGLPLFDAVTHTLSGISTGGFSTHREGVGAFEVGRVSPAFIVIMLFGAINFVIYYRLRKRSLSRLGMIKGFFKDPQVAYLLLAVAFLGLVLNLFIEREWYEGLFLAVSAHTTTGYSTFPVPTLPPAVKMILVVAMFIGGSFGSTAGGIKIFRLLIALKGFVLESSRPGYPKGTILTLKFMERLITKEDLIHISFIIMAYFAIIVAGAVIFVLHGYRPVDSIFEVTSGVGTVGLSSGIVSPGMPWDLKLFLIFIMWMGRIEVLPFFVWVLSFKQLLRRQR